MAVRKGTASGAGRAITGLALLAGVLATLVALGLCWRVVDRWLSLHVLRMDRERVRAAQQAALTRAPAEVREGYALLVSAAQFAAALRDAQRLPALQTSLGQVAAGARRTQLPRLFQAACRMRQLDLAAQPIESWWPALRDYLHGLEKADFAHCHAAVARLWSEVYRQQGLAPLAAENLTEQALGYPYGPFLQYFARSTEALAAQFEQRGETAPAAQCRRLLARLLRQWTLDDGPIGLRLLAADLLARALRRQGAPDTQPLADDLEAWRSAYRAAARGRPAPFMGVSRLPDSAPAGEARFLRQIVNCARLAGGMTVALVVVGVMGWRWRKVTPLWRAAWPQAALATALVALVVILSPARVDLPAERARLLDAAAWWWIVLGGAALGLAAIALASLPSLLLCRGGRPWPPVATNACLVWIGLACLLAVSAHSAQRGLRELTQVREQALRDPLTGLMGPQAHGLLDRVRDWNP